MAANQPTTPTGPSDAGGLRLDRIGQIALSVTDVQRSVAFYRDALGARHLATFDPPGLAFFDFGGVRLMLDAIAEARGHASPIYLAVPVMDEAFEELRARGVTFEGEPHLIQRDEQGVFGRPGMETWMAFFRDPDGNVLALMSEVVPS